MKRLVLLAVALCVVLSGTLAHAGKIDDIKARGALVCGVKDSTVPFGFIDEQSKQVVGFDIDICKAVADKLGVKLELKTVTSATRIPIRPAAIAAPNPPELPLTTTTSKDSSATSCARIW